jgi:hypothetical protein
MKNNKKKVIIVVILIIFILITTTATSIPPQNKTNEFYYTYTSLTTLLEDLQQTHPTIFQYHSLGTTQQGRDIWIVKISDNITQSENEPEILYMGGVHGNEKPGFQVVIHNMKAIAENYTTPNVNQSFTQHIRTIVNQTVLYFLPMVNPDGVEANTRKNHAPNQCLLGSTLFKGVDLNRNYGYKWEELDKHPFRYIFGFFPRGLHRTTVKYPLLDFQTLLGGGTYRGPKPFSENETHAVKQFIEQSNITLCVDYHIFGEKIVYPWFWTQDSSSVEPVLVSLAENISTFNHYEVIQGGDWYFVPGSAADWMHATFDIVSFVIELLPSRDDSLVYDQESIEELCFVHLKVNLYLAERSLSL